MRELTASESIRINVTPWVIRSREEDMMKKPEELRETINTRYSIYTWIAVALILMFNCQGQGQMIKSQEGATVISNKKKPVPTQALKMTLIEDLAIGKADDPETSFSEASSLAVDIEGTIFILDSKNHNIKVYDKSGKLLRVIGKPGQGPGELGLCSGIMLTQNDQILVEDATNRRLALFNKSGEFIKNISMIHTPGLISLVADSFGGFIGREMGFSEGNTEMFYEIKKYNQYLEPLFSLDKLTSPMLYPGSAKKINPFGFLCSYQIDENGRIYYGRGTEYKIWIYDQDGNHLRTITKEYDRVRVSKEYINEILKRLNIASSGISKPEDLLAFPEFFPPFQFFLLDDQGQLYVRTFGKEYKKGEWTFDVFNPEGIFVSTFVINCALKIIKDGKAYGIEETEDGFSIVKRYSISWE